MATAKQPDIEHPGRTDGFAAHMPQYSDMCPVCGPVIKARRDRAKNVGLLLGSLREFGYGSLTREEVEQAYDGALAGEDTQSDIIRMMVARQMRDAGLIPAEAE